MYVAIAKPHSRAIRTKARFKHLPLLGRVLYVAELENGVVKIGFTAQPRVRACSLSHECRRQLGVDIRSFHILRELNPDVSMRRAEVALIERCAALGKRLDGRNEYFVGIDVANLIKAGAA